MNIKLKVGSITKDTLIETGENFLDVAVNFIRVEDDGSESVIETRKYAYPIGTSEEVIKESLAKTLDGYKAEMAAAEENKGRDELNKQADEVIASLTGIEF